MRAWKDARRQGAEVPIAAMESDRHTHGQSRISVWMAWMS